MGTLNMTQFQSALQKLHRGINPYTSFPADQWSGAWYGDPGARREIFTQALDLSNPGVVVEVGSFVGESAIFMAEQLKAKNRDAVVICIDTWYGGIDHYKGAPEKINMHFGRPDLYYRFVSNVIRHGQADMILPLAIDSINGARLLKTLGIVPNLIYVDASHEQDDVLRDYNNSWRLLNAGGVMLVDDLSDWFPGVVSDYKSFVEAYNLKPVAIQGEKAILVK